MRPSVHSGELLPLSRYCHSSQWQQRWRHQQYPRRESRLRNRPVGEYIDGDSTMVLNVHAGSSIGQELALSSQTLLSGMHGDQNRSRNVTLMAIDPLAQESPQWSQEDSYIYGWDNRDAPQCAHTHVKSNTPLMMVRRVLDLVP